MRAFVIPKTRRAVKAP